MTANICYPYSGSGNLDKAAGEAFMQVDWQIYSRLDRKVVHEVTTQGVGEVTRSRAGGDMDVFLEAFAEATRNLLADQEFHDLITGQASSDIATIPTQRIYIRTGKYLSGPIVDNIDRIRRGVVTVFAGDGHGSGFFVNDNGLVLTNGNYGY